MRRECTDAARDKLQAKATVRGTVVAGRGWARRHLEEHESELQATLGQDFVCGTLNLVLDTPLLFKIGSEVVRWGKGGRRVVYGAATVNQKVAVYPYRWQHCPLHIVELISKVQLRSELKLKDGDKVELTIPSDFIEPLGFSRKICWEHFWAGREYSYYKVAPSIPRQSLVKRAYKLSTQKVKV